MNTSGGFRAPSWKALLKLTRNLSVSSFKIICTVVLTYGIVNATIVVYALVSIFEDGFSWTNGGLIVLVIFLAFFFTLAACYLTYRYIIRLLVRKIYQSTLQQRILITEDIVQQADRIFNKEAPSSEQQFGIALNWSQTVHRYYQAVPQFFQSGITQYLNRIPIASFIISLKEDILLGNHALAAEKLRLSVDRFFENTIVPPPNNLLTWLLLIIDAVVLYGLIA